jgi:predicted nuclease with TOPRIM domain
MDNYYHLKKEYHDLRDHLTSILSENIELKDQLEDKQRKLLLNDKSLTNNAYLIRMVYGEVISILDS